MTKRVLFAAAVAAVATARVAQACDRCYIPHGTTNYCPVVPPDGPDFQLSNRWTDTATDPPNGTQGAPITLTWGFVPEGTTTTNGGGSNLIAFLDSIIGAGPGGSDLTQRPWFASFQQSFNRWGSLCGITYVYEPMDDGVPMDLGNPGVLGTRADVRIGGRTIDGPSNVLAFNSFPNSGDMVIDTSDSAFFSSTANSRRQLRNTIMHEHGHGIGLAHVESSNAGLLMEPFIQTTFDGPQQDDILAAHRHYGDMLEKSNGGAGNDSIANATPLGTVPVGGTALRGSSAIVGPFVTAAAADFVSIDDDSDFDFYSFTVNGACTLNLTLTPRGSTYNQGPQGGAQGVYNSTNQSDLTLTLYDTNGATILDLRNFNGLGLAETLQNFPLPGAGTYYVGIRGSANTVQLYQIDVNVVATPLGQQWGVDADGNWANPANWTGGVVPNAPGAVATFGAAINAPRSITLDAPQTAGQLNFANAATYAIGGTEPLTLDAAAAVTVGVTAGSHTISAPLAIVKDVTFSVVPTDSTLTVAALQPMTVAITKNGGGVVAADKFVTPSIVVTGGELAVLPNAAPASAEGTSVVGQLVLGLGTQLDLTNNALVLDYTILGNTLTDTRRNIVNNRLTSSLLDATTGIGFADNAVLGLAMFGGVAVDSTSVLVRYTRMGDANLDGTTGIGDFSALAASFNAFGSWVNGDFNNDQFVNIGDFSLLAANFNLSVSALAGRPGAVPEPSAGAAAAIAACAAGLAGRRRRTRSA